MTEDEARTKLCPPLRGSPCQASGCMMWRVAVEGLDVRFQATAPDGDGWIEVPIEGPWKGTPLRHWRRPTSSSDGYCGLAGRP